MPADSFSALLSELLEHPKRSAGVLALLAGVLTLVAGFTIGLVSFLQWRHVLPEQAKLAAFEFHFATAPGDEKRIYFFVVHPQGWQQTPVLLKKGDLIDINAAGSIAIDMFSITRYSMIRDAIDRDIKRLAIHRGEWNELTSSPEDFYDLPAYRKSMEQALPKVDSPTVAESQVKRVLNPVQQIEPARSWTGPSGYAEDSGIDTAYRGRSVRRVNPNYHYGALLGAIAALPPRYCTTELVLKFESACLPKRSSETFLVGDQAGPINPTSDGELRALWLIVNDVTDEHPALFKNKFFVDNLGFFYVQVTVTPGR